jgi:hypothetical protein
MTEVADPTYWTLHPLDTSTVMCLLRRSQGMFRVNGGQLEMATLIAGGCLEYPSLKVTEKGKDALRWHLHGSPLIEHLDQE